MTKYPVVGDVKTRLGKKIGQREAADLYKCFLLDIVEKVKALDTPFFIYYTPLGKEADFKTLLGKDFEFLPQTGSNLGERLYNGFKKSAERGYSSALALASDIPDLPLSILKDAVYKLETNEAILGPSPDGGYYLIGLQAQVVSTQLFQDINWSTETVYDETVEIIHKLNLTYSPLEKWDDVDEVSDLTRLAESIDPDFRNTRTWRFLKTLTHTS